MTDHPQNGLIVKTTTTSDLVQTLEAVLARLDEAGHAQSAIYVASAINLLKDELIREETPSIIEELRIA